jgi:hypothetical protein
MRNPEKASTEVAALSGFSIHSNQESGPLGRVERRGRSLLDPRKPKLPLPRVEVSLDSVAGTYCDHHRSSTLFRLLFSRRGTDAALRGVGQAVAGLSATMRRTVKPSEVVSYPT